MLLQSSHQAVPLYTQCRCRPSYTEPKVGCTVQWERDQLVLKSGRLSSSTGVSTPPLRSLPTFPRSPQFLPSSPSSKSSSLPTFSLCAFAGHGDLSRKLPVSSKAKRSPGSDSSPSPVCSPPPLFLRLSD